MTNNRPWPLLPLANSNPGGLGTFAFNLRFPGQYFDSETNNHYNYFRDYSPEIGRYIQSDPIGLRGGLNTYVYAYDPLTQIDPYGLAGKKKKPKTPKPPKAPSSPSKDKDIQDYLDDLSDFQPVDLFSDFVCLEAYCSYDDPCTGQPYYRVVTAWLPNRPTETDLPENCDCITYLHPGNVDGTGAINPFRSY